jgi:hypothetical protein
MMGSTGNVGCAALDGCASPAVGGVAGPTVGVSVIRGWAFLAGCNTAFFAMPKALKTPDRDPIPRSARRVYR